MADKAPAEAIAEKTTRSITDALEYLEDKLKVSQDTRDKINGSIDRLQVILEEARDEAEDKTKVVRRQIRRHPGTSVAIAAAAGVVIGLLLSRRD
ncbi:MULTISPECIES: glycine zipper domain-containing protein [Asticcacaulis]|jgi:ElaB/YqjD/DUF883 family membrane-anchored ribosome-binding protein|uniref:DUF883 domain-containing protein n=2 Tax=Asticcacaulis excentricus TaxID=78587 RepID=E8RLQ9_ASTEC|nr:MULTISPECIES: hypothetical protein [Asticcacaulis]ADU12676.1 protein of unknown function DUF883 ElaB [Asticcacaulis excentricus CB 48]MCA1935422.1 hypothetical protein [Asticcacaulis sp.]BBF80523.1 hypothetical protein EM6_1107 [Asticcacaulis excentricus]